MVFFTCTDKITVRLFKMKENKMPELPIIMINDFLDTDVRGIFTTQYIEQKEMLLLHNLTGLKVKIVKEHLAVATYLFSLTKTASYAERFIPF